MSLVDPTDIARIAYEARRAYARALGEPSLPDWDQAPPHLRQEILLGVEAVLCGAASSGARLHELLKRRLPPAPGSQVDYQHLPIEQRRKLLLLRATVLALVDGPCTGLCHDDKCHVIDDHPCHLDTCLSRFGIPPAAWQPADRSAPAANLYS